MSDSRQPSQYDAPMRLGHASHSNASHSKTSTAPPGITSDPGAFRGPGHQEFNQMHDLLGTLNPFEINQEQEYSTDQGISHLHPREDEIDLPAAGNNTHPQYQGSLAQGSFGKNVDEYLQRPTAPAWNPAIAAQQSPTTLSNTLQQIQLSLPYLTPPRQQGHLISDEGYYTYQKSQQDTRSERSDRSNSFSHMINGPQAIPRTIPDQQRSRGLSQGQASNYSMELQQTPTRGGTKSDAGSSVGTIQCRVAGCSWKSKTPSDDKKHFARHKLEHVCKEEDCARNDKGFATVNDLNRHMMTVHKQRLKGARIYRCFAPGCNKPQKDWPRKDNFKSHLSKAHPNEDVSALTRRSEEWWDRQQHGSTGSEDREMFMSPAPPVTEYPQRVALLERPFYSSPTSDSDQAQTSSGPQAHLSQHLYVPQGAQYASSPMPGTTQHVNRQNALRRQQLATLSGYQVGNSDYTNVRSSGQSSGGFPHSSSVTLPEQQHRASVAGPTIPYARTEHHGDHPQPRDWSMNFPSGPTSSHMSRAASFNRPTLQLPTQSQMTGQRPQTVADFRNLEEDRQEDMGGFPAYQHFQEPHDTGYHGEGDILSGIGFSMAGDMFSSTFADEAMPEIRVQQADQMEIDHTSEDNTGTVNVDILKKFLEPFTSKADDDPAKHQMKHVLKTALLSLESTTGEASSAASNVNANTDSYIEVFSNAAEKIVFRCKWPKCSSSKKEWNLRSEIKKHMKRHSKPYGCTFDKCYRQFGSKSDWIRHETKRHTLQESWRCMLKSPHVAPAIQPCRRVFGSKQHFVDHLSRTHNLTKENRPEDFTSQLTKQHIDANFQPQYWCGFHRNIIRLVKKGKEGIHERYNHIVEHITSEGKCMDDWMPAHGILSRGQLRAKYPPKQGQLPDEEEDDASPPISTSEESNSTGDGSPSPPQGSFPPEHQHLQQAQQPQRQPSYAPAPAPHAHAGQKRTSSTAGLAPSAQRGQRRANFWRCHACQCTNLLATSPACTSGSCSHEQCPMCTPVYQRSQDER